MKKFILSIISLFLAFSQINGHLCDNIFRRIDKLIIKPEKDFLRVEKKGTIRIFIKNGYPAPLHNVRLIGKSKAFYVKTVPSLIEELEPGEKSFFSLTLIPKERTKYGNYTIEIWVSAKEFRKRKVEGVMVSLRESLKEKLKRNLKDRNWYVRIMACEELAKMGDFSGLEVLKEAVKNRNKYIRGFAVRALIEFDTLGVPLIIEATKDEEEFVRGNAFFVLSEIKTPNNVSLLKKGLKDRSEFVKACAASGLLNLGNKSMLPLVKEKLRSENKLVKIISCETLGVKGDTLAIRLLEELTDDKNWVIKTMAGKALVRIRKKQEE